MVPARFRVCTDFSSFYYVLHFISVHLPVALFRLSRFYTFLLLANRLKQNYNSFRWHRTNRPYRLAGAVEAEMSPGHRGLLDEKGGNLFVPPANVRINIKCGWKWELRCLIFHICALIQLEQTYTIRLISNFVQFTVKVIQ